MSVREIQFKGFILKTSTKWIPPKGDLDGRRVLNVVVEVGGADADSAAKSLLNFHPEESIIFSAVSEQGVLFNQDDENK